MSMVMQWDPVAPEQLKVLLDADPEAFWDWLEDDDGRPSFDLDKAWHAVHTVLTGTPGESDTLLGQAVLGGVEFGEDEGYGPPRYLSPDEVTEIAHALADLGEEQFAARVDLVALDRLSVYPGIWHRTDEAESLLDFVVSAFATLLAGFREATWRGDAMVITCT